MKVKISAIVLLAIIQLLSINISYTQTSTTPGTVKGKFSVSSNGAATYQIKIDVPPGINKMQPKLHLTYSSQGGNGTLGYGWALSGEHKIERTKAIIAVDGFSGGINYDDQDRFAINGNRIIATKGTPGAPNTEYHTQIESGKKIISNGQCGSGPCSFTVTTRKGETISFGGTTDSKILVNGNPSVRVWAADKVTDLNGNTISYTYTETPVDVNTGKTISSPGGYYLSKIEYTSNGSTKSNRYVAFQYEARPDIIQSYIGGYEVNTSARLSAIQTFIGTSLVKTYSVEYDNSQATNRSRVISIEECDGSTPTTCFTKTIFSYNNETTNFNPIQKVIPGDYTVNTGWTSNTSTPITMGDVNGDGMSDIIGFNNGVQVALANGSGSVFDNSVSWSSDFSINTGWTDESSAPRYMVDVNGDGLADILGFGQNGVEVAISKGSHAAGGFDKSSWNGGNTFQEYSINQGWGSFSQSPRTVEDVNGDGLTDLIGFGQSDVMVAISTGNTFKTPVSWTSEFTINSLWQSSSFRLLADVNGDHKADIIGFQSNGVLVGLSTGSNFETSTWNGGQYFQHFSSTYGGYSSLSQNPITLSDVNGDGLADIIGFGQNGVEVALSTGKKFLPPVLWCDNFDINHGWGSAEKRMLADVNADGMADIIGFQSSGVLVALSKGSLEAGGFDIASWNSGNSYPGYYSGYSIGKNPRILADINGDGLPDLVGFNPNGINSSISSGPFADQISELTNGIGGNFKVQITTISDKQVYSSSSTVASTDNSNALSHISPIFSMNNSIPVYPVSKKHGGSFHVVSSYKKSNVASINKASYTYKYTFSYQDALYNRLGRGWLGFAAKTTTDIQSGKVTKQNFLQEFPFTGNVIGIQETCGKGVTGCSSKTLLSKQVTQYNCQSGKPCLNSQYQLYPNVFRVQKTSDITNTYDFGVYKYSIGSTYDYDDYGNKIVSSYLGYVTNTGKDLSQSDNIYTLSEFYNDAANNRLGYLVTKKVTKDKSSSIKGISCSTAKPSFNSASDLSLTSITYTTNGKMNISEKCSWNTGLPTADWSTHSFNYDAFGNKIEKTDPLGNKTNITFETTYNTYPDFILSPANVKGVRLKVYHGYDPRFGEPSAIADLNGHIHIKNYNGLGRLVSEQGPIPKNPSGISSSKNELTYLLTGSYAFSSTNVVTLSTQDWKSNNQEIYKEIRKLQSWTLGTASSNMDLQQVYIDGLGRKVKTMKVGGCNSVNTNNIITTTTYNSAHKVTSRSFPYYENKTPFYEKKKYDIYMRPIQITQPMGSTGSSSTTTKYEYSMDNKGLVVKQTYGVGSINSYERQLYHQYYNGKQKVTSIVVPSDNNATTSFEYDVLGRVIKSTSPVSGSKTITNTISYNSINKKSATNAPSLGNKTYLYNKNGKTTSSTDNDGTTSYAYDNLNRLLSVVRPDKSITVFEYDGENLENGKGLVSTETSKNSKGLQLYQKSYKYDKYQKSNSQTLTVDGKTYTSTQEFDPRQRITAFTYPDGEIATYTYNQCQLSSIDLNRENYATYDDYNASGQYTLAKFGNGTTNSLSYSPTGYVVNHVIKDPTNAILISDSYTRDELAQITKIDDQSGKKTNYSESFSYDNLRLTTATSAATYKTINYSYDQGGNILSKNGTTYKYNGHQVISGKGKDNFSAKYNPSGSIISYKKNNINRGFDYDTEERLISIKDAGSATPIATMMYDYHGNRIMKSTASGQKIVYTDRYQEISLQSGDVYKTKYIKTIHGILASVTTGKTGIVQPSDVPTVGSIFFHKNEVKSTILTTNNKGAVVSRPLYMPYGEIYKIIGPSNFKPKYTGKELDTETSLYYYGTRYYSADLGRFISADKGLGAKMTRQEAFNRYAYALNNPIKFNDPNGKSAIGGLVKGSGCALPLIATGINIHSAVQPSDEEEEGDDKEGNSNFSFVPIAIGAASTVNSFVGCYGAIKDSSIPETIGKAFNAARRAFRGAREAEAVAEEGFEMATSQLGVSSINTSDGLVTAEVTLGDGSATGTTSAETGISIATQTEEIAAVAEEAGADILSVGSAIGGAIETALSILAAIFL